MKNLSTKAKGILLVLASLSTFAIADVCVKSTSMAFDPLTVALYLNIFTTLFLLPTIFKVGGFKKALKTTTIKMHFIRSMLMLCNFLSIIYALGHLPVASFYVIVFCTPFVLNILAMLILKERISMLRWSAIFIALIGIVIAFRPDSIPFTLPAMIALLSCLFNAGAILTVRFIDKNDHWVSYTTYLMIFQTPIILALMVINNIPLIPDINLHFMLWFIGGGLAYAAGLSMFPQAIKRVDASIVSALFYTVFPWGIIYGYFIFDDVPDRWTLLGAVIIIGSGLFLIYREHVEGKNTKIKNES